MAEWIDLSDVIPVGGYNADMMTLVDDNGAGQACYLQLLDSRDGSIIPTIIDPELAGQIAWEVLGIVGGYLNTYLDDLEIEAQSQLDKLEDE